MTAAEILADIANYVGGEYRSDWYAGIAGDPRARLFKDHNVDEQRDRWIYRPADSVAVARIAERTLHEAGFDGAGGGGDDSTRSVYAYQKTATTRE